MTEGNGEVRELPKGWLLTKLGQVCEVVRGGSPRPMGNPKYFSGNIPFIKIADITKIKGKIIFDAETKVNEEGSKKSRLLPKGSLILSNSGTVCIPKFLGAEACIHDGFVSFLGLSNEISKEFLFYYFQYLRPYVIQKHKQGITQVNLNIEIVSDFDLKLPPTNEQNRIIEKIEELFSDLDQGIESLKTSQKQLKVYRQAVLKWAFEGKLTEEWRNQHSSTLKAGEALLAEIKAERENRYQQQLAEWETAIKEWEAIGKVGKKPTKPSKPKELQPLTKTDISELSPFPNAWCLEKLGNFSELVGGVTKGRDFKGQTTISLPYLRVANVQDGYLDLSDIKYIDVLPSELDKYRLLAGDILYTEGGDKDKLGRELSPESL
ncbi:MAG: restriction endonuclease subunit S [Scytolyngbya sp. HA4215-MV1]|jgi:type I restriction enzyme S subunit|nr:restriction endonuclease subunit S [Scytolyngbya sp. HA4215-MV1]